MKVSAINPTQQATLTPHELLERFKKGERPEYKVSDSDKMLQELNALAQKYKQAVSVDKKADLINKEREMLYEELLNPELTLSRHYKEISDIMPKEFTPQEIDDTLRLFNITGIGRMERLGGAYQHKTPKENVAVLKNAYTLFDETTKAGNRGKSFIIATLASIEERNPKLKPFIQETYKDLLDITKDKNLVESITQLREDFDTSSALKQLKENPNNDFLFRTVIKKSSPNNNETREFITEILKSEKAEPQMVRTAILGGGKFRSDENFEIIKNIALDRTEKDVRKREFAVQSTALYLKDKPEEVKEVLQTVSREKSEFAPLGKILLDKISGNYHGQKDRELKYAGMTKKQADRFKSLFNRYYQTESPLNTRQENVCQLNTLPFRKQLGRFVGKGRHYLIQSDTYTKQAPEDVAKRYFFKNAGIYNSGDYMDAFDGIASPKYNMMNFYRVSSSTHQNQMAHENGHTVHDMFDKSDMKTLTRLYKKAMRENRTLDYYAAANKYEYFAQGCDAFASVYKPHKEIFANSGLAHTIYELIDKDPDLFKFIKKVLKKYH